jgi:hypothetical protein
MAAEVQAPPPRTRLARVADWFYRCTQALFRTPANVAKVTEASIKKAQEALVKAQERPLKQVTDGCVVVFNYAEHAMNACRDLCPGRWKAVSCAGLCSKPKGPLLEDVGNEHSNVNDYPEAPHSGASGGKVVAEHAPDPSDFWCVSFILCPVLQSSAIAPVLSPTSTIMNNMPMGVLVKILFPMKMLNRNDCVQNVSPFMTAFGAMDKAEACYSRDLHSRVIVTRRNRILG